MNHRTGKLTALDMAIAQARADMDAEDMGVMPAAPVAEPPPLPAEFKHGALFVLTLFLALVCLYLIAEFDLPEYWRHK